MKIVKWFLIIVGSICLVLAITLTVSLIILDNKTKGIDDDYKTIYTNDKYNEALLINDIPLVKQDISCGYAVIEMFAKWNKDNTITEQSLYDEYKSVVTQTGDSFANEMNKRFPQYKTTIHKYLKNTELIDKAYQSLSNGIPLPFEWCAKYNNEWTLHYSLLIGLDIKNDLVTILNPYGIKETIKTDEFLSRTSYKAYNSMGLFIRLGFAFGIFEKNTIFIVERI